MVGSGASFVGEKLGDGEQVCGGQISRATEVGLVELLAIAAKGVPEQAIGTRLLPSGEGAKRRVEIEGGMLEKPVKEDGRIERQGGLLGIEEATDNLGGRFMLFA